MNLNLAYIDPPKYGWTAIGGIAEILEPHDAARRGVHEYQKDLLQKDRSAAVPKSDEDNDKTTDVVGIVENASEAAAIENAAIPNGNGQDVSNEAKKELYYTIIEETKEVKEEKPAPREETRSRRKSKKSKDDDKSDPGDADDSKEEKVETNEEEKKDPPPKQIVIQTTKDDRLDIYTYHRGRVGQEPRNEKGELLAPLDPIDTNHDWRPNENTVLKIQLDFPLDDDGNSEYRFKDTIDWDLADSDLNVEEFATSLATDYGLSFKTTMEIIESVSRQIQEHVLKTTRFYPPIVIKDAYANDRPDKQFGPADDILECFGRREDAILNEDRGHRRGVTINRRKVGGGEKKKRERKSEGGRTRPMGAVKPQRGNIEVVSQSEVPKPNPQNDPYAAEVLRRAKLESQQIANECKARGDEVLWRSSNEVCHICHNRKPLVLTFHCGGHAYCDYHCATRLSFRVKDYDPSDPQHPIIDHCPICTLHCTCVKCARRLDVVGAKLKAECESQGRSPEDVAMTGILGLCNARITSTPKSKVERKVTPHGGGASRASTGGGSKKDTSNDKERKRSRSRIEDSFESADGARPAKKFRRQSSAIKPIADVVMKVNPTEFPKEIHDGKDTDPSEPGDDELCFVPGLGSQTPTEPVPIQSYQDIIPLPLLGPSNIDYCIVCGEFGELTNCHKCPRSYHAECLVKDRGNIEEDEKRCHRCKCDKHLSPDEDIDEPSERPQIEEAYNKTVNPFEKKMLELILEIVERLKAYDFGNIFSDPVNPDEVSGYLDVISTPMDYGTVIKKVEGGLYPNSGMNFTKSMDASEEIILHTICDIEQVHNNCMVFNQKGSSYFRIGYVHSLKWRVYYKKHVAERLSDDVRMNLEEFRAKCKKEQENQVRCLGGSKPQSSKNINAVGVYDPDTKRVVKQYASKAGALRAITALGEAGYECEYDLANLHGKTLIDKLTSTTGLIFGYRLITMDRLRSGEFSLKEEAGGKAANHVILKVDSASGGTIGGFESEEAAYSDWLKARSVGISSIDPSIGDDVASFQQHFLDGVNTINGVAWNRTAGSPSTKSPGQEPPVMNEEQPSLSMNTTMNEEQPSLSMNTTMDEEQPSLSMNTMDEGDEEYND